MSEFKALYDLTLCAQCLKGTQKKSKRRVTSDQMRTIIKETNKADLSDNEFVCSNCYISLCKKIKARVEFDQLLTQVLETDTEPKEPQVDNIIDDSATDLNTFK